MNFKLVYPRDLERLRMEKNVVIIDIRDEEAYRRGHFQGAVNYPSEGESDYEKRLARNRGYVLMCEHGGSSMQLARQLGIKGYRVASVVGGYEAVRKYQNRM